MKHGMVFSWQQNSARFKEKYIYEAPSRYSVIWSTVLNYLSMFVVTTNKTYTNTSLDRCFLDEMDFLLIRLGTYARNKLACFWMCSLTLHY
jgi:hypothetical protein